MSAALAPSTSECDNLAFFTGGTADNPLVFGLAQPSDETGLDARLAAAWVYVVDASVGPIPGSPRTERGVGLGDSADAVMAAYPEAEVVEIDLYGTHRTQYQLETASGLMKLTMTPDDPRVEMIHIEVPGYSPGPCEGA
jgi:hypothetical protein